jgi:hypothetical protein
VVGWLVAASWGFVLLFLRTDEQAEQAGHERQDHPQPDRSGAGARWVGGHRRVAFGGALG